MHSLTKSGLSLDEVKQRLTDTFDIVFTKYAREDYDTWFTDGHVRGTRTTLIYFSVFQQQWFYFSHGEQR